MAYNPRSPQEFLICSICEEPYDDNTRQAKFLKCHHTFCFSCLDQLSHNGDFKLANIQCPNCRYQTRVPRNGVEGLQTNFYITSFKEYSEPTETPKAVPNVIGCHGHNSQSLSYFCVTCGVAICADCKTVDHNATTGHSVICISEAEFTHLEELNVSQKTLTLNKRNLHTIETEIALLTAAKETAINDMETCIALAREQLEQRKNDLMNCILDQFNAKQTALMDKLKQIQEANELLNENITIAQHIITRGDLRHLKHISGNLKKVNEETKTISLSLDLGKNYLAFHSDKGIDEFKESFSTLGKVFTKGFLPSMISFRHVDAMAGHEATHKLEVYNHHGDKMPMASGAFSLQVMDQTNKELDTTVHYSDGSECTVTFTPQTSGLHKVSGMFLGQQLINEQTHISVSSNEPVLKFGEPGDGNGTFHGPWGIATDNNNCLYITDPSNKLIQKFTADGKFLKQFSVAVHGKNHTTCDIALDLDKELILCAQTLHEDDGFAQGESILVFNFEGELRNTYNLCDEWKAFSIAIDGHGDIILSNLSNECLFKVNKEGTFLDVIGPSVYPGYIAITDDGTVIVPDENNDCIYILNKDGTVRHTFGSSGTGNGELKQPCGVAADSDYILISEVGNNRVQIFKHDGTFVSMIESTEDPLDHPRGLAVTKDGHVYVVDTLNDCIKKYKYRDVPQ